MLRIMIVPLLFFSVPNAFSNEGYADLIARIQGAVVNVQTTQSAETPAVRRFEQFDFFNNDRGRMPRRESQGAGTGFFISADGYIVTNRHVVENASEIRVQTTDDRTLVAEVIGIDDSMDVALIKVKTENESFLTMADSDQSRIGDIVLALGYPLQLGFSVTTGIVSGIGRNLVTGDIDLANYIQTDADITFGNSGGPLVSTKGEVVGLNTLIVSRGETFGFAIPSNLFMHSVNELRNYGTVRRGALGVQVSDLSDEAKEYYGVDHGALIVRITEGLPAESVGLKRDDVILEINGTKIRGSNDVVATIANMPPDAEVSLIYQSKNERKTARLKLASREELFGETPTNRTRSPRNESMESDLGFSALPLNRGLLEQLGLESSLQGVVVHQVEPGSLADSKGLQPGTIVTHVNDLAIKDGDDFRSATKDVKSKALIPVRILELDTTARTASLTERTIFLRKQ